MEVSQEHLIFCPLLLQFKIYFSFQLATAENSIIFYPLILICVEIFFLTQPGLGEAAKLSVWLAMASRSERVCASQNLCHVSPDGAHEHKVTLLVIGVICLVLEGPDIPQSRLSMVQNERRMAGFNFWQNSKNIPIWHSVEPSSALMYGVFSKALPRIE